MRVIAVFVSFFLVMNVVDALNFRTVGLIPSGANERAFGFDTDHDGKQNLVFCSPVGGIQFWEHIGFDCYVLEDTAQWSWLCDVGYLDADSLVDMIGNRNAVWPCPLYVYESPNYNSNPTNIVWQDSGFGNIGVSYITDLDQDGMHEILFGYTSNQPPHTPHTCVYENTSDNEYSLVWEDTTYAIWNFINGDFDRDGRIEFITGNPTSLGGEVRAFECVEDNDYELIFLDTLPRSNNIDVFSANDMDGNGKPEFLFTSVHYFYRIAWLYLYETIGNNNYDFFLVDSVIGIPGSMFFQYSCCGDIDADGVEEIVWSTFNQWHVYKATGVHQYQKIYSSAWTTHDVTVMSVYDLNENGYPEIIESWEENTIPYSHGTFIWEIEGVRLHQPNGGETLNPNQQYPITWEKFDPPGADSFSLFFSSDSGKTYDTIVTGLGANDTMYLWTVPNILSDSCKIMIWAYGPPRFGEQQPRGTAWDFSDSVFTISNEGIKTDTRYLITDFSLKILPNPFKNATTINFRIPNTKHQTKPKLQIPNSPSPFSSPPRGEGWSEGSNSAMHTPQSDISLRIYDVTGRLVKSFNHLSTNPPHFLADGGIQPFNQVTWAGDDELGHKLPSGVYFIQINGLDESCEVKKVIKLE